LIEGWCFFGVTMHPELFRIGPLVIRSYGVMLALSFIGGYFLAVKNGKKRGIPRNVIINITFISIIASMVGSRLFYVLFHLQEFRGRWGNVFVSIQKDGTVGLIGLIFVFGFILAVFSSAVYMYVKKLDYLKIYDSVVPSIALGIFFTRIGCFLNGCCFGKYCELPWAVVFPRNSHAGAIMGEVPIHPTQLYASLYGLLIFGILMWIDRRPKNDGVLFGTFLVLYGFFRFMTDFFRFYKNQMFLIDGLQINQIISLLLLVSGLVLLYFRWYVVRKRIDRDAH
jgi:phosphatidylglycerol:prolipoprotein diacylglycerol transferase